LKRLKNEGNVTSSVARGSGKAFTTSNNGCIDAVASSAVSFGLMKRELFAWIMRMNIWQKGRNLHRIANVR
jgi:hypothetical protein